MSLGFYLKKIVGTLVLPLPALTLLLAAGLILLWFTRHQRAGKVLCTTTLAILYILSLPFVPVACLNAIERPTDDALVAVDSTHPGLREARWVVVLSGGAPGYPQLSPVNRVGRPTLVRLAEGVRLMRHAPQARLLVAGGDWEGGPPSAPVMRSAAIDLGVPPDRIVVESQSADTEENVAFVADIVGSDPFVVVTAAYHMPRTLMLFKRRGLDPFPVRAPFTYSGPIEWTPFSFFPAPGNLTATTTAWREFLGRIWSRL